MIWIPKIFRPFSYFALEEESANNLFNWFQAQNVGWILNPEEFHATVVYHTGIGYNKKYTPYNASVTIDPKTYRIINLGRCLCLGFSHDVFWFVHGQAVEHGYNFEFPYTPHITISYNPNVINIDSIEVPNFSITFTREIMSSLWDKVSTTYRR